MRGLTILETLVVTLIMSFIVAGLIIGLSTGQRAWFNSDVETELREQVIRAVMTMDRELSKSRRTTLSLTPIGARSNSISFNVPSDNNGDGSVIDNSGNTEWSGTIQYSLNASGQLIRSFAGINSVLTPNIITLQFTRTQDRLIQVDITAQKTTNTGRILQDSEQAVIKVRN